jgi:two-component sensor histidine kinase/CHASE1-domain containing sensor protein
MKHERVHSASKLSVGEDSDRPGLLGAGLWLRLPPGAVAAVAMLLGLLATFWAWRLVEIRETRLVSERVGVLASHLVADMQRHQAVHEQSLRAGAALVSVLGDVKAAQWRAIFDNLRIADKLPGVQGYGFAQAVTADELEAHVRSVRAQGFPNYGVTPAADRPFYTPITFLEPFDWRNQRVHGYDMYSDPERARAMGRAAETGLTAATARIRLAQEADVDEQAGFLVYTPVYGKAAGYLGRAEFPMLAGFVYSPIRVKDFFEAIVASSAPQLVDMASIKVFDGPDTKPEALIFNSAGGDDAVTSHSMTLSHDLFGQTWTLRLSPRPAFIAGVDQNVRTGILLGGMAISAMAGALVLALAQRQRQREEAAERNDMVAREMSHRVKNLLAVIQSIASRTLAGDRTLQEARAVLSDRIAALARAHSALVDGRWSGAQLHELLQGELAPFGERVSIVGPRMRLNSQMAQNLAMAVHELATNATKYGALSVPEGQVRIRWRVHRRPNGERMFAFTWEESGGPAPPPDAKTGFGRVLLRRLMGSAIGGEPEIEHLPDGLRYAFECPLERAGETVFTPASVKR